MKKDKTNKILATATVAIALSAAVQAISAFDNFKVENGWDVVAMTVIGLMVIFIAKLAIDSWGYLKE